MSHTNDIFGTVRDGLLELNENKYKSDGLAILCDRDRDILKVTEELRGFEFVSYSLESESDVLAKDAKTGDYIFFSI